MSKLTSDNFARSLVSELGVTEPAGVNPKNRLSFLSDQINQHATKKRQGVSPLAVDLMGLVWAVKKAKPDASEDAILERLFNATQPLGTNQDGSIKLDKDYTESTESNVVYKTPAETMRRILNPVANSLRECGVAPPLSKRSKGRKSSKEAEPQAVDIADLFSE